ncbi:MAG: hypothetical protein IJJ82_03045 [Clostridia bacterium]|nr:hypothetical protein [Clostridia bacterium]
MVKKKKIIIIIILILGLYLIYDFTPIIKVPLGYMIFGNEQCTWYNARMKQNNKKEIDDLLYEDRDHPMMGGCAITKWKCKLCLRGGESSTTVTPKLCDLCSKLTNRCSECGKLREK